MMKAFFRNNWIVIVIGVAFITSTVLAVRNNYVIRKNQVSLAQTDMVKQVIRSILTTIMHGLDLGVRGYGLTRDEKLLIPYREAIDMTPRLFRRIDSLLAIQQYPEKEQAREVMAEVNSYIQLSNQMIGLVRADKMDEFVSLLREDKGYDVWKKYSDFSMPLFAFEDRLASDSFDHYQFAIQSNLFLQFAILLLGFPMLFIFVSSVNGERKKRQRTLRDVNDTDRTYVFNNGEGQNIIDEKINSRSLAHVKEASTFVASLAEGDYGVQWAGLTDKNHALNDNTLAGNLVRLRDRLIKIKREDEQRNWANEGLAKFTEIVRAYQNNAEELGIRTISFLTKYIGAQQGSLFVVEKENNEMCLKLHGCYAFDKRKFIDKKVEIGSGLIGQAFLEGEPILLKQVPEGYTYITSGLGDATPTCVAVIPIRQDQTVIAVVEFATFTEIAPYQIAYLAKAGEFLASAIMSTRTSQEMKRLLGEAQEREEAMRQREEELRQNMEELQATQEQLTRNVNEAKRMRVES